MLEIRRGKSDEFYQIIDLIDFIFSKNSRPHDFATMYPNLYRQTDDSMKNLFNLWEDGVIKASALAYPRTLCVGGEKLKIYGIGSVGCHPRERGRGFMSKLLTYINETAREEGVQLLNLGGRRSRYNHFGFEIAGNRYFADFSADEAASAYPELDGNEFSFVRFDKDDTEIIKELKSIYESKSVHYDYDDDDFFLRMIIILKEVYPVAVYGKDNKLLGYLAVSVGDDNIGIREICLADDSLFSDVLLSYSIHTGKRIDLVLAEYQIPLARKILDICGDIELDGNGMWEVVEWKPVIKALLTHKSEYAPLVKGTITIGIESTSYKISFDGKAVSVIETTDKPDFAFSQLDATRALLGPVPAVMFGFDYSPELATIINSWFPLPLTWLNTERV